MQNFQPSYHLPSFSLNIDYMNKNINEILKNLDNDNKNKANHNNNDDIKILNDEISKEKNFFPELLNDKKIIKSNNKNYTNNLSNLPKKNKDTKIEDYLFKNNNKKPKEENNNSLNKIFLNNESMHNINSNNNKNTIKEIKTNKKLDDSPIQLSNKEIEEIMNEMGSYSNFTEKELILENSQNNSNNKNNNNPNLNINNSNNNKNFELIENKINYSNSQISNSYISSILSDNLPGSNYKIANLEEWQKKFPWDKEVNLANLHIFGYKKFRTNQREIINANMSGRDIFICMPTGIGKSLTYQIPAIIQDGVTIVIMPLISLIKDQSSYLSCLGINNFFYSEDSLNINYEMLFHPKNLDNMCKIIFITPERFSKNERTFQIINKLYNEKLLKRVVIDEAHCVSQWGREFRTDYLNLKYIRKIYPSVPILAMTATAPSKIREDVINQLGMINTIFFYSSYNRPNLFLEVRNKNNYNNVIENIAQFIQKEYPDSSGIIYCSSRKNCEELSKELKERFNINCDFYHALISEKKRNEIQEKWKNDIIKIIVATIAFGMGINKQDVRFVIHYSIPKSFETYYQEIGRAGRDGKISKCIIYYSNKDRQICEYLLSTTNLNNKELSEQLRKITQIIDFCEESFECRRVIALAYFDEKFERINCKKMCDNCKRNLKCEIKDCTNDCIVILNLLRSVGINYFRPTMKNLICHLRGVNDKKDYFKNFDYKGKFHYYNENELKKIIRYLIIWGYIDEELNILMNKNVYSSLKISDLGFDFLMNRNKEIKISFRKIDNFSNYEESLKEEKKKKNIQTQNNIIKEKNSSINNNNQNINKNIIKGYHSSYHRNFDDNNQDKLNINNILNIGIYDDEEEDYGLCDPIQFEDLLQQLKVLRRDLLKSENDKLRRDSLTGGFKTLMLDDIFPENGLRDLCRKLPITESELTIDNIFGVNKSILGKYGKLFLPLIKRFINVYNINKEKREIERKSMNEQIYNLRNNDYENNEKEILLHMGIESNNFNENNGEINDNKLNNKKDNYSDKKEIDKNIKVEEQLKKKANEQKVKMKKKKNFI